MRKMLSVEPFHSFCGSARKWRRPGASSSSGLRRREGTTVLRLKQAGLFHRKKMLAESLTGPELG